VKKVESEDTLFSEKIFHSQAEFIDNIFSKINMAEVNDVIEKFKVSEPLAPDDDDSWMTLNMKEVDNLLEARMGKALRNK